MWEFRKSFPLHNLTFIWIYDRKSIFWVFIKYIHIFMWISEWMGAPHFLVARAPSPLSQALYSSTASSGTEGE
jgi:hypothetical protein